MPRTYHTLDPILLHRLGLVVITWSNIEASLAWLLSWLLKADEGAMFLVTGSVSSATQITWIRTLVEDSFKPTDSKQNILDLLSDIDAARADRNALVHGVWNGAPEAQCAEVETVRIDRIEILKTEIVTLADLDELCAHLNDLLQKIAALKTNLSALRL